MKKTVFYVDRYLCKQDKKQNLDTFSFLPIQWMCIKDSMI